MKIDTSKLPRVRSTKGLSIEPIVTDEQVIDSIKRHCARMTKVAEDLGLDYFNLIQRTQADHFRAAIKQAREIIIDDAESVIRKAVIDKDLDAAKFVLRTLGKSRGWSTSDAPAVNVNVSASATANASATFGTDPERQAQMLAVAAKLRESAKAERAANSAN